MIKYLPKEEYIYMDLDIKMSTKEMASVLYAGIDTAARFTILWNMNRGEYSRNQNSINMAHIKVHIHPSQIENFNNLSGLKLKQPQRIQIND